MSDVICVKRQCERCPAVDEISVTAEDIKSGKYKPEATPTAPKYQILTAGKAVVSYNRLCLACEAAVTKSIEDIAKKREKKSSRRGASD